METQYQVLKGAFTYLLNCNIIPDNLFGISDFIPTNDGEAGPSKSLSTACGKLQKRVVL